MIWTNILVKKVQNENDCNFFPCDNITPYNKNLDAMLWLFGHLIKYFAIQYFYILVFKPKNVKQKKNFANLIKQNASVRTSIAPSHSNSNAPSTDKSLSSIEYRNKLIKNFKHGESSDVDEQNILRGSILTNN